MSSQGNAPGAKITMVQSKDLRSPWCHEKWAVDLAQRPRLYRNRAKCAPNDSGPGTFWDTWALQKAVNWILHKHHLDSDPAWTVRRLDPAQAGTGSCRLDQYQCTMVFRIGHVGLQCVKDSPGPNVLGAGLKSAYLHLPSLKLSGELSFGSRILMP